MEVASIVPVGKRVKQGDQLIAIDSTPFEDAVRVQQIVVEQAQAALKQVEVTAENTHLLKEAQLAEAALRTELAKVEVAEFQKGTHPLQLKVCQKEVQQAKRLLEEHKKLVAAGKLDSKSLEAGIVDLDVAETKLQVLEKYTGPKTLKDLEAKIATAKRDSQQVQVQVEGDMNASRAKVASQRAQVELELNRLKQVRDNLAKCSILAPHDGVVAAAGPLILREGSQVRQRQVVLILIPVENGT